MTILGRGRWRPAAVVLSQFVIGAIWIVAGIGKWALPDSFLDAVRVHGIVKIEGFLPVALIGTAEIALGVSVLALGTRRRAGTIAIGLSAVVLLGLSFYLVQVPAVAIKSAGCGCGSVPFLETRSHGTSLARNVLLLVVHVIASLPLNRRNGASTQTFTDI